MIPATRPGLTGPQARCLAAIERLTVDGVSPSYRQLLAEIRLSSIGSLAALIDSLVERGYLVKEPNRKRSLRVVKNEPAEALFLAAKGLSDVEIAGKLGVPVAEIAALDLDRRLQSALHWRAAAASRARAA